MLREENSLGHRVKRMIKFEVKGDLSKTYKFLDRILKRDFYNRLEKYGERGVALLSEATPVHSGKTSELWDYEIERGLDSVTIYWKNTNVHDGYNVAVLIQYGHGTGFGGYVKGIDYINPALRPLFKEMADEIWKEVTE